jgi:hypothetical protein
LSKIKSPRRPGGRSKLTGRLALAPGRGVRPDHFMRERDELFQFVQDRRIDGVLLSGDRHGTAGYQVQGRLVEITSSPFAAENHEPPYNPAEMFMLHDEGISSSYLM